MKILIACEFSGIVRDAFIRKGREAISCDLLPSESNFGPHYQGNVLDILEDGFDMMIAHPSCTYISNSGVRHLSETISSKNGVKAKIHGKERWKLMEEACEFFNKLKNAPIEKICLENPIPHRYARKLIGDYTQIIHPRWFGNETCSKATCLWLKNLPPLVREKTLAKDKITHEIHMASPGPDRWKFRSRTFEGIANKMAETWG